MTPLRLLLGVLVFWMLGCVPHYAHKGPLAPADLWTPAPVRHVQVDGVDIAYIDTGTPSNAPPVVLIHGLSSTVGFWEYQVPHLARTRRVIALDLPGFGASDRPDAPYTPPWYAGLIVDWLDHLGIERADVVGHSMGGQIALTLAHAHPDRIRRLVLSAPAGFETFSPGEARFMKSYWTETRALRATEPEVRRNLTQLAFNRPDDGVERLIEERVRLGRHPAFQGTSVAVSRCIAGMLDHPVDDLLPGIAVPTLVVFGTADRMIPNPVFTGARTRAIAERGVERLRDARLVLIDGAGHTVHHDAPEAFNQAVTDFLGGP